MSSASGSSCRRGTSPRGAKPSKNDEDELQRAHQLNNAVQKKLLRRPAIQKLRVDTLPFRGPPIGQSSFSVARIFVEAFVGDKVLRKGEVRQPQVCDHCGGRFGLLTHRWWSNKFCKKKCKDAHLRELALRRDQIRRWYGFLSPGGSRLPS